jgi:hypothetical protein
MAAWWWTCSGGAATFEWAEWWEGLFNDAPTAPRHTAASLLLLVLLLALLALPLLLLTVLRARDGCA